MSGAAPRREYPLAFAFVEEPQQPFAPPQTRTRRVASRIVPMQYATYAVVIATAIALLLYFWLR